MNGRFFIRSQCFSFTCVVVLGACMCVLFQVLLLLFLHASAVIMNLTDLSTLNYYSFPCCGTWNCVIFTSIATLQSLIVFLSCSFLHPPSLLLFNQLLYDHTDPIPGDEGWPVIGQFSSIGSMGLDKTKWLAGEFQRTMTTLGKSSVRSDPPMHLVRADSANWLWLSDVAFEGRTKDNSLE